jgi:translation initiation factor IF-2
VQNGTLRVGDFFMVGSVFGKVRAMLNDRGEKVEEAPPSSAVIVLGLDGLPDPGDSFQAVTDTEKAKQIVEFREERDREQAMAKSARLSLEQYQEQMRSGDVKELPIILKCDVQGSMEVLVDSLQKLSAKKVKLRIVRSGVGAISESDVLLATTASAIIIGFNVRPERTAAVLAEREHIDIRLHTVIYELVDEITKAMLGLLEPMVKETFMGRADVLDTFRVSKVGTIAGCMVQEGKIGRTNGVRLLRDNVVVYTGKVSSLKRFKDDASEVRTGQECGIGLENFNDVKPGDVIEAFVTEKVAQVVLA